jgi:hypothetical protein
MVDLDDIQRIAKIEYGDIVECAERIGHKLRILLKEGSFIDVYLTEELKNKFGFHWERRVINGELFRYDNYPDPEWKKTRSFPYHFHNGSQEKVEASPFSVELPQGFRDFMNFVRKRILGD